MKNTIVYVELEEGSAIPMFGEVQATYLGESIFQLADTFRSDFDKARFKPGSYVYCLKAALGTYEELKWVAYSELSEKAAKHITSTQ